MLVLTRRLGKTLLIGNDISITMLGINANQIRIGVDAPLDISVHREEVYNRIQAEKTYQALKKKADR